MKTLIVYHNDSVNRFVSLYRDHTFNVNEEGLITVMRRNPADGEEHVCASFRNWDYYIIEGNFFT